MAMVSFSVSLFLYPSPFSAHAKKKKEKTQHGSFLLSVSTYFGPSQLCYNAMAQAHIYKIRIGGQVHHYRQLTIYCL
jgi:hypothetical protein